MLDLCVSPSRNYRELFGEFVEVEKQPFIRCLILSFVRPRVNREEGEGDKAQGRKRTWRGPDARAHDEPKIRAKWLADPVVSCDRKWHSFLASSRPPPPSSTKSSRRAGISTAPCSISLPPLPRPSRRVVTYPFLYARTNAATTEDCPLLATR